MSEKVVPFREVRPTQALKLIRQLGQEPNPIGLSKHARRRLRQREVSWPQIRHAIKAGKAVEGPYQDHDGHWICRLEAHAAGKNVAVVVKMENEERLKAVTVIVLT